MANNNIYARIQQKIDTEENWNKAVNFVPLKGEIIVYDIDSAHDYKRIKIGDGVTTVINLEFVADINDLGAITIDIEGATEGTPATIDADTFNGYTIDNFVMYNTDDGESDYMAKSVYDTDSDGVVDNAAKLGGKTPGQLTFGADQIITDEGTDKRLPQTLDEKVPAKNIVYNAETIDSLTTFAMRNTTSTATDSLSVACKAAYGTALWFMFSIAQPDACVQYAFPYGTKNGFLMRNYNWWTKSWSSWESVVPASGGKFTGPIWVNNANPPTSSWNVKDITVTKSDGSSITGGITKVIAMRRK